MKYCKITNFTMIELIRLTRILSKIATNKKGIPDCHNCMYYIKKNKYCIKFSKNALESRLDDSKCGLYADFWDSHK